MYTLKCVEKEEAFYVAFQRENGRCEFLKCKKQSRLGAVNDEFAVALR